MVSIRLPFLTEKGKRLRMSPNGKIFTLAGPDLHKVYGGLAAFANKVGSPHVRILGPKAKKSVPSKLRRKKPVVAPFNPFNFSKY
jgi:hypothetical protein